MLIKCFKRPEAAWGSQVLLMMLIVMSSTGVVKLTGVADWNKAEIEPWKVSKWTEDWTYGSMRVITFKSIRSADSSLEVNIIINWRSLRRQSTDQFIISLDRCHISALLQKTDQYLSWVVFLFFSTSWAHYLSSNHAATQRH